MAYILNLVFKNSANQNEQLWALPSNQMKYNKEPLSTLTDIKIICSFLSSSSTNPDRPVKAKWSCYPYIWFSSISVISLLASSNYWQENKTIKMIFLSKQFQKIATEQYSNLSNLPTSSMLSCSKRSANNCTLINTS